MNTVMRNDLYLESIFLYQEYLLKPIVYLDVFIYNTKSFHHRKEAIRLKISYMTAENECKMDRNAVLLNVLLYIVSLLGAIGTLEILKIRLNIPFRFSFFIVILVVPILELSGPEN